MEKYDIVVIGGGPGGSAAAALAAKRGLRAALVEKESVGGACLLRGCIPAKAMLRAAETLRLSRRGGTFGVKASAEFDYAGMVAYREKTVSELARGAEDFVRASGAAVLRGRGRLAAPGRVKVTAPDGEETVLAAPRVVLATGSKPKTLPVPGADLPGVIDSDGVFALRELPRSIVIVGGGAIGVEMAEALSAMGAKVTLLEAKPRLLPEMDRDFGANLRRIFKKRGVEFHLGAALQKIERREDGLRCVFTENGEETAAYGRYVLCAVGRRADTEGLFCEDARPRLTAAGQVAVDENFRTSAPGVYAVGDLIPGPQLAHAAAAQGRAAVERLLGEEPTADLSLIPRCVYTDPEIAQIGMNEEEAAARGVAVVTGKALLGGNGRWLMEREERSFIKVTAAAGSGVIVGAQLMCPRATDMIGEFAVAAASRLTAGQMLRAARPHPTFEETIGEALENLLRK